MRVAATFGRFRILQLGHLALIRRMVNENDRVIVGISRHSSNQRSAEVIRHFFSEVEVVYSTSPFSLLNEHPEVTNTYLGSDQAQLGTNLMGYHSTDLTLINRPDNAPSSTRCRELYNSGADCQDYIDAGLSESRIHSLLIISQAHLETLNND